MVVVVGSSMVRETKGGRVRRLLVPKMRRMT